MTDTPHPLRIDGACRIDVGPDGATIHVGGGAQIESWYTPDFIQPDPPNVAETIRSLDANVISRMVAERADWGVDAAQTYLDVIAELLDR